VDTHSTTTTEALCGTPGAAIEFQPRLIRDRPGNTVYAHRTAQWYTGMVLRGRVHAGRIIIEDSVDLPEGAKVRVK
jgi:hypothetical protein